MNDPLRDELEALRLTQRGLRLQMETLDQRIEEIAKAVAEKPDAAEFTPPPLPTAVVSASSETPGEEPEPVSQEVVHSAAPPIPQAPATPVTVFEEAKIHRVQNPPADPPPVEPPKIEPLSPSSPPPVPRAAAKPSEPMEMKIGQFWLVRIGIVTVLTGLVFFGKSWVATLGPGGKLALLTLTALLLGGIAVYLHRRQASLRNYARVLGAGAGALGYYCAYAAHFVESLRVIASPLAGGVLLIVVGLGLVFVADRAKSQSAALLAILLSFYTSSINPQPGFALLSNLLLIAAALILLLRHEWVTLSFACLTAAYASFAYWRVVHLGANAPAESFTTVMAYLCGYWVLFTICVFASRSPKLRLGTRAAYLTANNGAFFAIAGQAVASYYPEQFWVFALSFGIVLLLLAGGARQKDREDALFDGSYLAQGLALVALGFAAHFSKYQLSVIFALESALLIYVSRFRHRILLTIFSLLAATAAWFLALLDLGQPAHVLPAAFFLLASAVLAKREGFRDLKITALALFYALAGLLLGGLCAWQNLPTNSAIALFAVVSLCFCFTLRFHRMPEIALGVQGFLIAADFLWSTHESRPLWLTALLLISNLALMHWWKRQKLVPLGMEAQALGELLWALAAAAQLFLWQWPHWDEPFGLCYLALLAAALLAYGLATRSGPLAFLSIPFTAVASAKCLHAFCFGPEHPFKELLAILIIAAQQPILTILQGQLNEVMRSFLPRILIVFRVVICGLLIAFLLARIPAAWQTVVLAAAAFLALLTAFWKSGREPVAYSLALAGGFFAVFLVRTLQREDLGLFSVLPLLLVMAIQVVGKRKFSARFPSSAQALIIWAGVFELVLFTTLQVWDRHLGHLLTIAWAVLAIAVTGSGFLLRERLLRLLGLGILALAVLHVYLIDVWQTESAYRYLSFLILGILLLGLSFLYNKLSEFARRWL